MGSLPDTVDGLVADARGRLREHVESVLVAHHGCRRFELGITFPDDEMAALLVAAHVRIDSILEGRAGPWLTERLADLWPVAGDPGDAAYVRRAGHAIRESAAYVDGIVQGVSGPLQGYLTKRRPSVLESVVVAGEDGGLVVREAAVHERVRGEALASLHGGLTAVQREAHEIVGAGA